MFKEFFFTELTTALKKPMVYIFLLINALLVFGAVASDNVIIGGSVGNVYKNAPTVIATYVSVLNIFGILFAAAFFNNAALRDHKYNFNEILFSTPISKSGYFFGRFLASLILASIPMLGVYLGIFLGHFIGTAAGWVLPDRFGAYYLSSFVNSYFLFVLPNMFFAGSIIYALASKWKNTTISFLGALLIIIAYIISGTLTSDIENETLAAMVDSFGIRTYNLDIKYFTTSERNTISPSFSGLLLINRIVWIVVGLLILLISYFSFNFAIGKKASKKLKKEGKAPLLLEPAPVIQSFSKTQKWQQFASFFSVNTRSIVKSAVFVILLLFSLIMLVANLTGGFEYFGLQSYPVTYKMIGVSNGIASIFNVILIVFFSGELVWRDRDTKINEVVDASPHHSGLSLIAKTLSLLFVACLLHFFATGFSIFYQAINGYFKFELGIYFLDFIYRQLPVYFCISAFAIFLQVVVNHKYLGYFLAIVILFLSDLILLALGLSSNMLSLANKPRMVISDMNGFGPALESVGWFNLYWILFSCILIIIAGLFWVRGYPGKLKERFSLAKRAITVGDWKWLAPVVVLWIATSSFIFYNTQILNEYNSRDDQEQLLIRYETELKKYNKVPLPKIISALYNIDIYPGKRDVLTKSKIWLQNKTSYSIDSIHFNISNSWEQSIEIENAELVFDDDDLGYRIFELAESLNPGDSLYMEVQSDYVSKGFENEVSNSSVVKNGTFLNNFSFLPGLGYSEGSEISDRNKRKKFGLPEKNRMPALEKECSSNCYANYLTNGSSDWVDVETFISTSSDQIAIAPGSLVKEWNEGERKYYHYKVDRPSQNFYSFISAKYEVTRKKWKGIDIEIYHEPEHGKNVPMMIEAVEKSLAYYTENFGPYYHKQARIIEFPRYATFAQAFPGTMPYSESFGFIIDLEDMEDKNNVVEAVIAHEMGHQWWAHQLIGARMQGSTMLSESFSEYSSLMVMKQSNDDMQMREFLKYDFNRYLRGRSGETQKETPLYKVENQGYVHYGKGAVVLYALQDYIGEENLNEVLSSFLEEHRYAEPPYPTSHDFLEHLEQAVPDSLLYLIDDWFKTITLYDLRIKEAAYTQKGDKYEVSLEIQCAKMRADSVGNEVKSPINDWVDIGVFADAEEKELIGIRRVKVKDGMNSFTLIVDQKPAKAGVDPRRLLIERVYDDNIKSVKEAESSGE